MKRRSFLASILGMTSLAVAPKLSSAASDVIPAVNKAPFGSYVYWADDNDSPDGLTIGRYVGNGTIQDVSRALGYVPTTVVIKRTDAPGDWIKITRDARSL